MVREGRFQGDGKVVRGRGGGRGGTTIGITKPVDKTNARCDHNLAQINLMAGDGGAGGGGGRGVGIKLFRSMCL